MDSAIEASAEKRFRAKLIHFAPGDEVVEMNERLVSITHPRVNMQHDGDGRMRAAYAPVTLVLRDDDDQKFLRLIKQQIARQKAARHAADSVFSLCVEVHVGATMVDYFRLYHCRLGGFLTGSNEITMSVQFEAVQWGFADLTD